ncbi:MAG: quinolinate synthase NadA [Anaerovoracaceae bacterium]
MESLKKEIIKLKKEKQIAILAHYYVPGEVQDLADYVGDSYYLSKIGTEIDAKTLCFCGVSFMGESGKILNPDKTIIVPDLNSDCPMAHMASPEVIAQMRKTHHDLAVVCYVNSTAELKANSDVCVTSSNAEKVIKSLPNQNIFFVPDQNLGDYIASRVSNKNFILNKGYCPVHHNMTAKNVLNAKKAHPSAELLVHPECKPEVVALSDYAGSTSGIIEYATKSSKTEFIIGTELGVIHQLKVNNPNKDFYPLDENLICPGMKLNTLEALKDCLLDPSSHTITLDEKLRSESLFSLKKMLELS